MKQRDVVIGQTYCVKVSGRIVPMRVTNVSIYGGWDGVSTVTRRAIRLRTAAKLRRVAEPEMLSKTEAR